MKNTWASVGKYTLGVGWGYRFGFGLCIDRWSFNIDLGPFWFYLEW